MDTKTNEIITQIEDKFSEAKGDLYYFEAGDGKAYTYGGCEHYEYGLTVDNLIQLAAEFRRLEQDLIDSRTNHIDANRRAIAANERADRLQGDLDALRISYENADRQRGEALVELSIMQNERDAAEREVAKIGRISDSEMICLLRRRAKYADTLQANLDAAVQALEKYADRDKWTKLHSTASLVVQFWSNGRNGYDTAAECLAKINAE